MVCEEGLVLEQHDRPAQDHGLHRVQGQAQLVHEEAASGLGAQLGREQLLVPGEQVFELFVVKLKFIPQCADAGFYLFGVVESLVEFEEFRAVEGLDGLLEAVAVGAGLVDDGAGQLWLEQALDLGVDGLLFDVEDPHCVPPISAV